MIAIEFFEGEDVDAEVWLFVRFGLLLSSEEVVDIFIVFEHATVLSCVLELYSIFQCFLDDSGWYFFFFSVLEDGLVLFCLVEDVRKLFIEGNVVEVEVRLLL